MSGDSLAQIATECGFAGQSHLSHLFYKIVGERPGAWRRATEAVRKRSRQGAVTAVLVVDIPEGRGLSKCSRQKTGHSSPDCRHERGYSEDLHCAFHIVG